MATKIFKELDSTLEADVIIEQNDIVLFYFSAQHCNVCKALKPKIEEMSLHFPEMNLYYVDVDMHKEFSGKFNIFTIPVILVFIQGKETIRESRNISVPILEDKIQRYYHLLFNQ